MKWCKVDDSWINFDVFAEIRIKFFNDIKQYEIYCTEKNPDSEGDVIEYQLFSKCFRSKEDAAKYLDKFMKKNLKIH